MSESVAGAQIEEKEFFWPAKPHALGLFSLLAMGDLRTTPHADHFGTRFPQRTASGWAWERCQEDAANSA